MKYLLSIVFISISMLNTHAQSNWSLQASVGAATETNLGDTGLRLSAKANRQIGKRWAAFAQIGTFQMFRSNENWEGNNAYQELRSLSTTNLDLGGTLFMLNKSRVRLSISAAGSYRAGRQLWPEFAETINGHRDIYYTHEKISEMGYSVGIDISVKATDRLWFGLDTHCHNYNYFGEYIGIGLNATVRI